jgi:multiple antibiotic resistance protein
METFILSAAKVFILLFAVVDPFGNVPLFLAMTGGDTQEHRRRMALRACVAAFVMLTVFAVGGRWVLRLFSVDVPAFKVAGGLVLTMMALPMLSATRLGSRLLAEEEVECAEKADISIVPLAIPLLAGPGAITAVMAFTQTTPPPAPLLIVILTAGLVLIVSYFILRASSRIAHALGDSGVNVLTRISGLLILVVAVQFILDGARAFFQGPG